MNIKDLFDQKENQQEFYWSVVLESGWVQAGVWCVKNGIAEVVASSPVTAWESDEELLEATDATLSSVVQKLPEEFVEPVKTVFGVGGTWVKDGEIAEEYLEKIKKICTKLSLTPAGFVVLSEAIAHLFKSEEGIPVSAIILGLGKEHLEVSIFNLGNLIGSASVARSVSLVDDVVEGLSRFEGLSSLPSRIVVFDGREGELNEAMNLLSGTEWENMKWPKFLHTPKIEILDSEKKILATSLAGASELGKATKIKKTSEDPLTIKDVGFVVGEDVSKATAIETVKPQENLQKTKDYLGKFFNKGKLMMWAIALGFFVLGSSFFWWFYPKASVAIYVLPKKFEEEFDISFEAGDINKLSASGENTKTASGIKLVGEKTRGVVSLRNGTDSAINFLTGTILISSGDLRFSLDKSASVSAAIDADNPGTASVDITAMDIGAAYNLAKDEVFKIGNYPKADAYAKSTSDFSGGSSREVLAISKEDREKLLESLLQELTEKIKSEFIAQIPSDRFFVDSLVSLNTSEESFSRKVGDEADTLKLNLSVDAEAIIADKKKLTETIQEKLKNSVPQGFTLRDDQVGYKFEFIDIDGEKYNFKVNVKANFLPEVKTNEIVRKISGRVPSVVENYLSDIPGFSRAEIRINPRFPGIFGTLPRVTKNITIEIKAEK